MSQWIGKLLWAAAALLLLIGVGALAGRVGGFNPHLGAGLAAAGASLLVTALALLPPSMMRQDHVATMTQASLLSTIIHLMGNMGIAGIVVVARLPEPLAFVCWLAASYWATLVGLVVVLVRLVHDAPAAVGDKK